MNDDQLRALIREAVARRLGADAPSRPLQPPPPPFGAPAPAPQAAGIHPSHYQYVTLVNAGEACLIEPAVACNHCGYCRSHGH